MSTQLNKVHSVTTISLVAKQLGVDEELRWDVATGMEPEDGLIWVYGLNDEGVIAFSDYGIESLQELLAIHLENTKLPGPIEPKD